MTNLQDKVALVTGATSGIGKATALELARMGATTVLVARDAQKGATTLAEIKAATGNPRVELLLADLSAQASIRKLAEDFKHAHEHLHVLVNNAGGFYGQRMLTADGLETTFAINHLAYFLLTSLLLDTLKRSAPARIVNVSSNAQSFGRMRFDDLQGEGRYDAQAAYSQSKLANVMFTYELARRLQGTGVTVNALHPGVVRTNFGRQQTTVLMGLVVRLFVPFMRSPEKGAETVVYLATSPDVEGLTGQYFSDKKAIRSSQQSYDEAACLRLWQISEQLTGVTA
jgi:NAD(P)-dependent dehydrogenase (short-subunit alcohol dehydrogenase family)